MSTTTKKIVILTGAGISAESGIRTFRDSDGLWEDHAIEEVATPQGFVNNPELVLDFYNQRRKKLFDNDVQPNKAHLALAKLEKEHDGEVVVITQNIDNLHERAGSLSIIHMHGELLQKICSSCQAVCPVEGDMMLSDACSSCQQQTLRPHIVWFGEIPLEMDAIYQHLEECDIFAAIGTSGQVYPAAGFAMVAQKAGAISYQINLETTAASGFDHNIYGKATDTVVPWVDNILQS